MLVVSRKRWLFEEGTELHSRCSPALLQSVGFAFFSKISAQEKEGGGRTNE